MKTRCAGVISIALFITFSIAPAQASVKSGLACKKLGSTSIVGAYTYTCIKSGKKLIWNKGVKKPAVKPTPIQTPTVAIAPTPVATQSATPTSMPTQSSTNNISRAEVALHNRESDCWTYVDLKVYDLTRWLPEHPGGASLVLGMCGVDGAAVFRDHHKAEQDNALSVYFIGTLK